MMNSWHHNVNVVFDQVTAPVQSADVSEQKTLAHRTYEVEQKKKKNSKK